MIDLHTHILPGIDDGAQTLEDALAMARVFVAEGVTVVAATPHVRDDFPTSASVMLHSVAALRRVLDEEEIPLTLLPGAEVAVDSGYAPRVSHRCSLIPNGIPWCRRRRRCSPRSSGAGRSSR